MTRAQALTFPTGASADRITPLNKYDFKHILKTANYRQERKW
jgi:hypothetical protein